MQYIPRIQRRDAWQDRRKGCVERRGQLVSNSKQIVKEFGRIPVRGTRSQSCQLRQRREGLSSFAALRPETPQQSVSLPESRAFGLTRCQQRHHVFLRPYYSSSRQAASIPRAIIFVKTYSLIRFFIYLTVYISRLFIYHTVCACLPPPAFQSFPVAFSVFL